VPNNYAEGALPGEKGAGRGRNAWKEAKDFRAKLATNVWQLGAAGVARGRGVDGFQLRPKLQIATNLNESGPTMATTGATMAALSA